MQIIKRTNRLDDLKTEKELDDILAQLRHKDETQKKVSVITGEVKADQTREFEEGEIRIYKTSSTTADLVAKAGGELFKVTLTKVV